VLVVACANLANLMLARGTIRQQEIAVRRALGASRWPVIRELLVEARWSPCSAGRSVWRSRACCSCSGRSRFRSPRLARARPGAQLAGSRGRPSPLLSLVVFGLEPAIQVTRKSVTVDLTAQPASVGHPRSRRQRLLIGGQVAISTSFLLVAAILARIIIAGAAHDSGIALDRLALTTVHFSLLGWDEARARRTLDRAVDIARRQPDIESVAVSSGMPFGRLITPSVEVTTPDKPFVKNQIRGLHATAALLASTPQIFATLQVPLVRGACVRRSRRCRRDEGRGDQRACRARAVRHARRPDAVPAQFLTRAPVERLTVIGVTRDTDVKATCPGRTAPYYVPLAQRYVPNLVCRRASGNPAAAVGLLPGLLQQADPELSTGIAGTATMLLAAEVVAARLARRLAAAPGLVMIVLAMVGLYGIQMHVVASRTREVGLRMALGASVRQIQQLVLRQGYRPVIQGVVIGIVVGSIARLGLKAVVVAQFQVFDPLAIALVALALVVAAFLACYLPARRASRVDPNVALRHL
jgi:putative ABC transport system permease protein